MYLLSSVLVNIIRSVPFVILLVLLLPLTQFLLGNTIGPIAASVPLSVAAIAFYARLVDSALREVDKGIIEAAEAFGASPMRIICTVLLPEASAGLLRGLTITLVSLIGYSAMAGIVGGGGVGDGDSLRLLPLRNPCHDRHRGGADYSGTGCSGAGRLAGETRG